MTIGEKLWEGKARPIGMSIKGANSEGVMPEYPSLGMEIIP